MPYVLVGGNSFFDRKEVRDVLAYLRLLVNPSDNNAFYRIANVPRRKIGTATLDAIGAYAQQQGEPVFTACANPPRGELNESGRRQLRQFHAWMTGLARRCAGGDSDGAVRALFSDIDYRGWLEQNSTSAEAAERRWSNVEFLLDNLLRSLHFGEDDSIEAAIERLILRDLLEQQEEEDQRVVLGP